jgi:acyl-CoA synthetase (AMP-forming)/AMP-acid ligase II
MYYACPDTDVGRYINDDPSTEGLFDEDGYFRTGDIAHRQDDCYVFDGRVSIDCNIQPYLTPPLYQSPLLTIHSHQKYRRKGSRH